MATVAKLVMIGVVSGISSGFFGIGGGIVIVPALIYGVGFQRRCRRAIARASRHDP